MKLRILGIIWLLTACLQAQSLDLNEELFPRPESLLPNINFWKRVYSELDSNQIIFSDYDDLSLVYQVIDVPSGGKAREQAIKKAKHDLVQALKELDQLRPDSAQDLSGLTQEVYLALENNKQPDKYSRFDNIRAQNGLKKQFEEGYRRSGAHDQEIRARLRKAGLPEELIGIVFVESLFHPKSKSSVGATGLWQFMRRTAHEFMRVNKLVDERLDPIVSTDAAIKYLKSAKASLGEWPLAITSYNYGRGGMAKAVEMTSSRDFEVILENYENPRFGFAARNYYAEFLAAVEIYKQAESIFPDVEPVSSWAYEIIQLPKPISVRDLLTIQSLETVWLRTYNPALRTFGHQNKQILPKGFTLRVPTEHKEKITKKIAHMPARSHKKTVKYFTALPAPTWVAD